MCMGCKYAEQLYIPRYKMIKLSSLILNFLAGVLLLFPVIDWQFEFLLYYLIHIHNYKDGFTFLSYFILNSSVWYLADN